MHEERSKNLCHKHGERKMRQQRKWDKPAEREQRYKDAAAVPQRKNLLWGKYSHETWGRKEPQHQAQVIPR